ncbi:MAG: DUF4097 family beta strand repeat-containing protein, partial [Gemmatimonadaceae bacterium]
SALLAPAFVLSAYSAQAQSAERVPLKGNRISIYNVAGRVHVTGGGSNASATITRRGRDASKLKIVNGSIDGRESLRIIYPDDRVTITTDRDRHFRTEFRVRDDGTFGRTDDARSDRHARSSWGSNRSGRTMRVSDDQGGLDAAADIEVQVPDGVSLRVNVGAGEVTVNNVNGDLAVDVQAANLTVSGVKGVVDLDVGSGHSELSNITGSIRLDAGSGNVVARNLNGPTISLDTGSGSVAVDGCSGDKMLFDTGSGSLRLTGVRGRTISLDTGSGAVSLALLSNPDLITVDSGSGDVTLTLPPNFAALLRAETGSGTVQSEFPVQLTSKSRDQMIGRIGSGGGRLTIDTGSGSVRLIKAR